MYRHYASFQPISSYGLISYTIVDGVYKYLIYQRRDTFEYTEFIRGTWVNEAILPMLFSLMTEEERYRIRNYTLQEIWDDLWIVHDCRIYIEGFYKAKKKYLSVKNKIPQILDSTSTKIPYPPWGFPKGKRNFRETQIECAKREFTEETHIPLEGAEVYPDKTLNEIFKGTNGKIYSTHFYIAKLQTEIQVSKMSTPQCIRKETVSEEAADVKWCTLEEAETLLHPRHMCLLKKADNIVKVSMGCI